MQFHPYSGLANPNNDNNRVNCAHGSGLLTHISVLDTELHIISQHQLIDVANELTVVKENLQHNKIITIITATCSTFKEMSMDAWTHPSLWNVPHWLCQPFLWNQMTPLLRRPHPITRIIRFDEGFVLNHCTILEAIIRSNTSDHTYQN